MTASWMTATLDAPREGGGGLLPEGVNNYTITDATVGANQWNGKNEVTLRINCPAGGGKTNILLEPWDMNKVDDFVKRFTNDLGNIGIETQGKTIAQVLATLPQDIKSVIGNVVEFNVKHSDRKAKPDGSHLKDDGTPWKDAKAFINRLVAKSGAPAAAATVDPAAAALDAAFAAATPGHNTDDDIPF